MGELFDELKETARQQGGQPNQLRRDFLDKLTREEAADVVTFLKGGRNMAALRKLAAERYGFAKAVNTWHNWSGKARAGEYDDYLSDG